MKKNPAPPVFDTHEFRSLCDAAIDYHAAITSPATEKKEFEKKILDAKITLYVAAFRLVTYVLR